MNGFLPAPPHAPQVQILRSRHHILLTLVFLTESKIKSHFKNNKSISKRSKQTIYCYTFLVVLLCLFLVFMVSPTWIKNNTFINDLYLYSKYKPAFVFYRSLCEVAQQLQIPLKGITDSLCVSLCQGFLHRWAVGNTPYSHFKTGLAEMNTQSAGAECCPDFMRCKTQGCTHPCRSLALVAGMG